MPANDARVPAPTLTGVLTTWDFHVVPVVLTVVLGAWYVSAVVRMARRGGTWPLRFSAYWAAGLAAYVLATVSVVRAYSDILFSAKALQVTLLMMVVPQLLAHGLPGTLARDSMHPRSRRVVSRALHSRLAQRVTHPLVGVVILIGLPIALYGSGWYQATLTNLVIDELTQLGLLVAGFHYFWTRLQRDPVPHLYPQVVTVVVTFVDVALDSVVPLALLMTPTVVAEDHYTAVGRDWGPSLAGDQDVGAGILWMLGDLAGIPFLLLALSQWIRRDQAEAAEIDRQLDADDARQYGSTPHPTLWWENDAYLAEHFQWRRRNQ